MHVCCLATGAVFCCDDSFVLIMIFSIDSLNTKVVANLLILVVLKFHDFRTTGLRVIYFINILSDFVCVLNSAALLCLFD
jgi:hypothetical protein